ncbi:MAG: hypothetical protein HRF43_15120 [Phycisphaerae bacterium]|jgi:hypothetical protein
MNRLPRFAGTAVFLLAMIVLMLEIALTRVFSVMTYNHFTYLIIGLALLGFGAAGTLLTVGRRFQEPVVRPGLLADCAWLFGVVTILSFLAVTKTRFDSIAIQEDRDLSQLFGLLMLLVLAAVPFFMGGLCIGYLVSKSGEEVNRIYFCDLTGAGLGALASVLAINHLGAPAAIFVVALVACVVAMLLAGRSEGRIRWRYPLTALAAAGLAVASILWPFVIAIPFEPSKGINRDAGFSWKTPHRWHVVARVDVTAAVKEYPSFGGALSRTWDATRPPLERMGIWQDGGAFTGIVNLKGRSPGDEPILGHYMQAVPYILRPGGGALVIGAGGGVDVAIALYHGAPRVTAVDINPWTIRFVRDEFNDYAGGLYNRPDVEVVVAEGRHYLTATDRKYDVIQLSGVDTFSALASGAYALSENYLYTLEAIDDCLNALTDDGVLSYSRWLFTPPRESLRLAVTIRAALEKRGVARPDQHLLVLAAPAHAGHSPWADIVVKKRPFSPEEIQRVREWAGRLRFDLIYDPLTPPESGAYDRLVGEGNKYQPAVSARWFNHFLRAPAGEFDRALADYDYRIAPCSDDSPFFFNYYRLSNLRHPFTATYGGDPVNRLPLGLMILLGCLAQIVVIGGLFILWPMRGRSSALRGRPGAFSVLLYFGAIGLGFIAVEIMLLQKLTVLLGGPVYSMAVTLFSLLVFCGLGSFLAKRLTQRAPKAGGAVILLLLAAAIFGTTWLINHQLPSALAFSLPVRAGVAVVALLPLGLLMGMPFPTGVRVAERLYPGFVPWGWCVNACTTVLGSVLAVLAAMFTSFTAVLYGGMGVYLLALLALLAAPQGQYRPDHAEAAS